MKKSLILLLVFIAADIAFACSACSMRNRHNFSQNEGFAFSAGIEVGAENINGDREPYIGTLLNYDEALLGGKLDIYLGFGYFHEFVKKRNADGDEVFPKTITLDAGFAYNLDLRETSTLSLILESNTDFRLAPRRNNRSLLSPGIKFTETVSAGDIYTQFGLPIHLANGALDGAITLGWISNFGLGISADTEFNLSPNTAWARKMGATLSYSFEKISIYTHCFFKNIGNNNISINPSIGFVFSF